MTTPKPPHNPSRPHTCHKRSRSPSTDIDDDDDEYNPTPCPRGRKKPKTKFAGSGTEADPVDLTGDSGSESDDEPAPAAKPVYLPAGAPPATPSAEDQWLRRNFPRRRPSTMAGVTWTTFWPARPAADRFGRIRVGRSCYYDDADNFVRDLDELAKPVPGAHGRADFGRASLRTRLQEAGITRPIMGNSSYKDLFKALGVDSVEIPNPILNTSDQQHLVFLITGAKAKIDSSTAMEARAVTAHTASQPAGNTPQVAETRPRRNRRSTRKAGAKAKIDSDDKEPMRAFTEKFEDQTLGDDLLFQFERR
ncbi:hypothetical protein FN846DRAFT_903369 [Sphaerosporella brunnea]|uniref:Uncharacterized protein n=1 Tax=Sphaerosporella brunnea TaxID=1250544 RepID=A0A5J5F7A2_9PEZI|nr:hypothetical protein FN846DRAFT_903369 [Sphaerosporella brunnea]